MKQRLLYLDFARIIATVLVVLIHVSGWFSIVPNTINADWDSQIWGAFAACAVPMFFIISGTLFLSSEYELSVRKLLYKILKIAIIWVVWNILYALANLNYFSIEKLAIWTFKGHFHFWFFEYIIGIYLIAPILKGFVEYKNGQFIPFFLICWVLFGIIRTTVDGLPWHEEEIHIVTSKVHFELADFSGYFILGHFLSTLRQQRTSPIMWFGIYFISSTAQLLLSKYCPLQVSTYSFTLFVLIQSISLFMVCKSFDGQLLNRISHLLVPLSTATLGVYILHPFVLEHCTPNMLFALPTYIRVIVLLVYVLTLSFVASLLLGKVKFIKKWLLSI